MAEDELLERLLNIVAFVAGAHRLPTDLGAHTPISEGGLELDSATVLELIVSCEAEFSVTLDADTDFTKEALGTVGTLAESVRRAAAARG
jgi:acyl carrier protein